MATLAICIPTFHDNLELDKTLYAFRKQTFQDYRVYVADYDPDRCNKTKEVAAKHNAVIIDVNKKGIGYARHLAALYSTEPLILAWDADAYFEENDALERMIRFMRETNADIVHAYQDVKKEDLDEFSIQKMVFQSINIPRYLLPATYTPSILIKRSVYNELGGFRDVERWEDILLGAMAVARGKKVLLVPRVTVRVSGRRIRHMNTSLDFLDYNNAYRGDQRLRIK